MGTLDRIGAEKGAVLIIFLDRLHHFGLGKIILKDRRREEGNRGGRREIGGARREIGTGRNPLSPSPPPPPSSPPPRPLYPLLP